MRRIFYALLLCNGLLFIGHLLSRSDEPAVATSDGGKGAETNRLLRVSEVDPSELRARLVEGRSVDGATGERKERGNAGGRTDPDSGLPGCYTLGPLSSEDATELLRAWLQGYRVLMRPRVGERRELALYWVYLPPYATRAEALQAARQMQQKGLKDIFVIPGGDMAHAISLGVYTRRASLEHRLNQLKQKGFEPSVLPRYRMQKVSWLDLEVPVGVALPAHLISERFPAVEVSPRPCS